MEIPMAEEIGASRITRFIKAFLDFLWWAGLVVAAVAAFSMVANTKVFVETFGGFYAIPPYADVGIAPTSSGLLALTPSAPSDQTQPELSKARARLVLRSAPQSVYIAFIVEQLIGIAIVLFGVHLLRGLLRRVINADVFTDENADCLSRLGWLFIVAGILRPITSTIRAGWLIPYATGTGFRLETLSEGTSLPFWMGLFVLILAAIWRYGVELQRERDLTV